MKKLVWFLILSLFVSAGGVEAGTTGKVTGVVKDATSGEPLPGVSVVIVGTRRGGVTDASGTYIVLSVEPGTYTLTATLVGYQGETKRDVQVAADFTTTVGFSLKETAIQMGEVTVMAERPPVEPDKTTSKYVATAKEIEQIPLVRSTAGLVQLMPGVALDGSARIRGSEISEGAGVQIVYYVDGIKLANNDGKAASPFTGINRTAIQELSVLTGGMEAEYGNAEGGVVNIITKEGGGRLNGYAEYRFTSPGQKHWGRNSYYSAVNRDHILIIDPATGKWTGQTKFDNPTWASETDPRTGKLVHEKLDYTDISGHFVEGNLSGGLGKDLTFFVSGQYSRSPSSIPSTVLSTPLNFQNNTSLTWRATANVKAKLGLIYAYQEGYLGFREAGPNVGGGALPGGASPPGLIRGLQNDGRDIFLPSGATYGKTLTTNDVEYLVLTHTLSSKTFYDLRLSRYRTKIDSSNVPPATEDIRRDKDGWFYLPRAYHAFQQGERTRFQIQLDFSSQVTKGHLLKTGFDMMRYSMWDLREQFTNKTDRYVEFIGKDHQFRKPFRPILGGVYVQDKMEFQGLVVNAGLRFDFLDLDRKEWLFPAIWYTPMYNSLTRMRQANGAENGQKAPIKTTWSPRFGVSHPISSSLAAHFFTGLFYQFLDLHYVYAENWRALGADRDLNNNKVIDPTEVWNNTRPLDVAQWGWTGWKPERTATFEIGFDWNFVSDYVLGITTFYRDFRGGLRSGGTGTYIHDPKGGATNYTQVLHNDNFSSSRGFEVSFKKSFSHNFSFKAAYNANWVGGNQGGKNNWQWYFLPTPAFVQSWKYWTDWTANADGSESPKPLTDAEKTNLASNAQKNIDLYN
ncbi:MAG: hypothetical protein A3F84_29520, partial [Candidatus Handelsmanbacteria bacterium RIFCSPLOWO2_12_FULL_64_10]